MSKTKSTPKTNAASRKPAAAAPKASTTQAMGLKKKAPVTAKRAKTAKA